MIPGPRDAWATSAPAIVEEVRQQGETVTRLPLQQLLPEFADALVSLGNAASSHLLDRRLVTLIRIRVSQIVGSAADVRVHLRKALRQGEHRRRLHLLAMWRVTDLFDVRERSALALVEAVTLGSPLGVHDDVWDEAADVFSAPELAQIVAVTVSTIAVNTVGLATGRTQSPSWVEDSAVVERSG